ncbi:hypothetical protein J6590_091337, partial [Homalodisca vitripennis]
RKKMASKPKMALLCPRETDSASCKNETITRTKRKMLEWPRLDHISRTAATVLLSVEASKGRSWTADRQTGPRDVSTNERRPLNRMIGTTVTWISSRVLILA